MGLAYIISAISLFDEYSNDLLYLREGSCFPRYHVWPIKCSFARRTSFPI